MTDLVSQLVAQLEDMRGKVIELCQTYGNALPHWSLERTDAALTAAKAGGWQDISTAPKDGTEILLLFGKAEYILGAQHGRVRAACWTGSGSSANWSIPYFKDDAPTHWQPLPNPPKEQA